MGRDDGKSFLTKEDPFYLSDVPPVSVSGQPAEYQRDKSGGAVKWELYPGVGTIPGDPPPPLNCVAFCHNGLFVACGTGDGRVGVWSCLPLPSLLTILREEEPACRTLEVKFEDGPAPTCESSTPAGVMRCKDIASTAALETEDAMTSVSFLSWCGNKIVALGPTTRLSTRHEKTAYSKHLFKILVWDMKVCKSTGKRPTVAVYFADAVDSVWPHPTDHNILVACSNLQQQTPYIVHLDTGVITHIFPHLYTQPVVFRRETCTVDDSIASLAQVGLPHSHTKLHHGETAGVNAIENLDYVHINPVGVRYNAIFSFAGDQLYCAVSSGIVVVLEYPSLHIVAALNYVTTPPTPTTLPTFFPRMYLHPLEPRLLLEDFKQTIYHLQLYKDGEHKIRLRDMGQYFVRLTSSATKWGQFLFSGDASRVLALPTYGQDVEKLCVWHVNDQASVHFRSPLQPLVLAIDFNPDPGRPMCICATVEGSILCFVPAVKKWPGPEYPAGFVVLEDNFEFVEREDEFDIHHEATVHYVSKVDVEMEGTSWRHCAFAQHMYGWWNVLNM
jgi:hypothetical protein